MNSFSELCSIVDNINSLHIPRIYKYENFGLRFRDAEGELDSAVAQNSNGTLAFYAPCNIDANGFTWFNGGADTTIMTLTNGGNLDCYGDVTGFNQSLSDSNFKSNIQPYTDWSSVVNGLDPVSFVWNDDTPISMKVGKEDIGILAQQVSDVFPLAHGVKNVNGTEVQIVKYEKLITVLLAAVKSHEQRILELEKKLGSA